MRTPCHYSYICVHIGTYVLLLTISVAFRYNITFKSRMLIRRMLTGHVFVRRKDVLADIMRVVTCVY